MHWRQDASLERAQYPEHGHLVRGDVRWLGPAKRVTAVTKVVGAAPPRLERGHAGRPRTGPRRHPGHLRGGAQAHLRFSSVTALAPSPEAWLFGTEGTLRLEADARRLSGGRRGDKALCRDRHPRRPANRLARRRGVRRCHPRHARRSRAHPSRTACATWSSPTRWPRARPRGRAVEVADAVTGEAALSVEQAAEVRERFGTPCYVYDPRTLEAAAQARARLPGAVRLHAALRDEGEPEHRHPDAVPRRSACTSTPRATSRSSGRCAPASRRGRSSSPRRCRRAGWRELVRRGVLFNACSLHQLEAFGKARAGRERLRADEPRARQRRRPTAPTPAGPASSFGIWHEYLGDVKGIADAVRR